MAKAGSNPIKIPRIKVCGITRAGDLDVLVDAGVDSVGFNFVPSSPRYLRREPARELCARAGELGLLRVAVVMDMVADELAELLDQIDIDWVQLHGQESPSMAAACRGLPILKATSWSGRRQEAELVTAWLPLANCGQLCAWLVDAYAPVTGGGTGRTARWDLLRPRPAAFGGLPLILAGGLRPENVEAAIAASAADGVDTASGVESEPGLKSAELIAAFANRAALAWR